MVQSGLLIYQYYWVFLWTWLSTTVHLSRVFRRITGMPPGTYCHCWSNNCCASKWL